MNRAITSCQKILTMLTCVPDLRSSADGWGMEDGDMIRLDKPIGLSGSPNCPCYKTPLHAIGDGWRLMAPPVKDGKYYTWWLEK